MVIFYHLAGLPWGRNFYPHTHPVPIPMGIPMGICIPTVDLRAAVGTEFLSPYPSRTHTHGDPNGDPHTHGRPDYGRHLWAYAVLHYINVVANGYVPCIICTKRHCYKCKAVEGTWDFLGTDFRTPAMFLP